MNSKKKPHILFLPEWYPNPEDPQLAIFVEKFARAASLAGTKVSLIYCGPFAKENKINLLMQKHKGFTEYFCYYPFQKNKLKAYSYFIKAHQLCYQKLISEDGMPDIVHLHMLYRNYIAYKKFYAQKVPKFLITEQWSGYGDGTYRKLPFLKKMQYRDAFKKALYVTAVSNKAGQIIKSIFTIHGKYDVLPNIAEKSVVLPNKNLTCTKILVVADLVDSIKNISGIIAAYGKSNLPKDTILTIIGDGVDREKLEQLAKSVNLANKEIVFLGRLPNEEVLKVMNEHHFLITNSRHETFSMVTAEALLAGLPVICTRCGGPEEFVNETNGYLINIDANEELQSAIEKMCLNYADFNPDELSIPVLKQFGIETIGNQLNNIYHNILQA